MGHLMKLVVELDDDNAEDRGKTCGKNVNAYQTDRQIELE
jgi:hypothetical protein